MSAGRFTTRPNRIGLVVMIATDLLLWAAIFGIAYLALALA